MQKAPYAQKAGEGFRLTPEMMLSWYKKYNALYFNGELPEATLKNFEIRHYSSHVGCCHYPRPSKNYWRISETDYYIMNEEERLTTFIHEMCHLSCFIKGNVKEHHGPMWKAKAEEVNRLSGLKISRVLNGEFPISEEYIDRRIRMIEKRNRPCPILVFPDTKDHVFIIKTSRQVIGRYMKVIDGKLRLKYYAQPLRMFVSDSFPEWTIRKSLERGYRFPVDYYEENILPLLEEGEEYFSVNEIYMSNTY